jgi:hypothetical protein
VASVDVRKRGEEEIQILLARRADYLYSIE